MKSQAFGVLLLSIGILLATTQPATAQLSDTEKRWALRYTGITLGKPVLSSNPDGQSTGGGSEGLTLTGELYLPKKWNLQAGYFRSEISYGDCSRTMEGLHLGAKKYFLSRDFILQPYLSAAAQVNWGRHLERESFLYPEYGREQYSRNPRLSFLPGAGLEFYLFSSVAFVVDYSFAMGIDSRSQLSVYPDGKRCFSMADKGMYHNLQLGVKLTFPFTFTGGDTINLISLISDLLFNAIDRHIDERIYR